MKIMETALALVSFGLIGCGSDSDSVGAGNVEKISYPTVTIGNQVWMAANLNAKNKNAYSYCYDGDPVNCEKYGILYSWEEAMKACPSGWHLPGKDEMETFIDTVKVRVKEILYQKGLSATLENVNSLYQEGEEEWFNHLRDVSWEGGFNTIGFSALPAGYYVDLKYNDLGSEAYFWTSTEETSYQVDVGSEKGYTFADAYCLHINDDYGLIQSCGKGFRYSVRCLKD